MYQVIKMYGDFEPWWLLDGWQKDIVKCDSFENYQDALGFYKKEWHKLSQCLSQHEDKTEKMSAFWDPKDQRWCEECDEFLQQYHSLLILDGDKNQMIIPANIVKTLPEPKQCRFRLKRS